MKIGNFALTIHFRHDFYTMEKNMECDFIECHNAVETLDHFGRDARYLFCPECQESMKTGRLAEYVTMLPPFWYFRTL